VLADATTGGCELAGAASCATVLVDATADRGGLAGAGVDEAVVAGVVAGGTTGGPLTLAGGTAPVVAGRAAVLEVVAGRGCALSAATSSMARWTGIRTLLTAGFAHP
jgi:hypothetical protein